MLGNLFGGFGGFGRCSCGCEGGRHHKDCQLRSCDIMWIIILLLIIFKGGFFGIDICTLVILFIVFGKDFFCFDGRREKCEQKCC